MAFAALLKANARAIKKYGHLVNSEKRYRKCMMGAGLLEQAYNTDVSNSLKYLYKKNRCYTEQCQDQPHLYEMKTDYKTPKKIYDAMWDIAHKRDQEEQAARKEYAWKFIHKHIEYWWD
jgi:Tfp pilus tip-associated adhesin PilY1